jgi:hypothetical protein
MYTFREGSGLATRMTPLGTRILSEESIVRAPEVRSDTRALRVNALTPDQRQVFLYMHSIHVDDAVLGYLGLTRTNALPFVDGVRGAGIFPDACRAKNSCDNNAQKIWNGNIKRHAVHTSQDIENGEEITIYYLEVLGSHKSSQEALRERFAFTCSCRFCSLPPDQIQEIDRGPDETLKLDSFIGRNSMTENLVSLTTKTSIRQSTNLAL